MFHISFNKCFSYLQDHHYYHHVMFSGKLSINVAHHSITLSIYKQVHQQDQQDGVTLDTYTQVISKNCGPTKYMSTRQDTNSRMEHTFGVNNISLELLLFLGRSLYNVWSYLVIWGRFELRTVMNNINAYIRWIMGCICFRFKQCFKNGPKLPIQSAEPVIDQFADWFNPGCHLVRG